MSVAAASIAYRSVPADMRQRRDLGPLVLIHHRRSGITHMTASPVPEILDALDAIGPADATMIARWLQSRFDLAADEGEGDVVAVIAARLEELDALGLVTAERP
jgi:PqqD family protein of HPr-rel-A system